MKRVRVIFFLLLFLMSLDAFAENKKRVLLISSYNPSFPTFFKQVDGIKSVFKNKNIHFDIEFMDSKRFSYEESKEIFKKNLQWKLKSLPSYDLVITSDDNALHFILENKEELFLFTPVVFLGVNNVELALKQNNNPNITGVIEAISMLDTLLLMRKLHPEAKKFIAISDGTTTGLNDLKKYYSYDSDFPKIQFTHLSLMNYEFDEFFQELSGVAKNTPVLLLSPYVDKNERRIDFDRALKGIKRYLSAPLYHLWYHGLGDGVIGGKVIDHYNQGVVAAEIALNIVTGNSIKNFSVKNESPNKYVFDNRELKKFLIDSSELPRDSQILYPDSTFYETYKTQIYLLLAMLFIFLLIITIFEEIRFRKKVQIIKEQEQKFRAIFDQTRDLMGILTPEGIVVDANQLSLKFKDVKKEDVVGELFWNTPWWQEFPETQEQLKEAIKKASSGSNVTLEVTHIDSEGKAKSIEFSLTPILNEQKEVELLIPVGHDITRKVEDFNRLKSAQALLIKQSRAAALNETLQNISHQWRQPLNIIGLLIQEIEYSYKEGELTKENLEELVKKSNDTLQKLSKTIDKFTTFSDSDNNIGKFSSSEAIEGVLSMMLDNIEANKIVVEKEILETSFINGSRSDFMQVIVNILLNATQVLTKTKVQNPTITITTDNSANKHTITIADNGGGIDENIIDMIFEPYFTTKFKSQDVGLGLYISKLIIEDAMGGKISVENQNQGAAFTISLPTHKE